MVAFRVAHLPLPGGASAAKKAGSLPPSAHLPCAAPPQRGRGKREAQPRFAFLQRTREIRVVPRPVRRFGYAPDHNGRNSARSERRVVVVVKVAHSSGPPPLCKWAALATASA